MGYNLSRLEDTPIFRIHWYYATHQDMWCSSFIVSRFQFTFLNVKVKMRDIPVYFGGEIRGIMGSKS